MVRALSFTAIVACTLMLSSCNDEWEKDTSAIARNDFAMIQLETDICRHAQDEGGCLRHLKARIQ